MAVISFRFFLILIIFSALLVVRYVSYFIDENFLFSPHNRATNIITIATVSCGDRYHETLTVIKSAIVFNNGKHLLKFITVTEEKLKHRFENTLRSWQNVSPDAFQYSIYSLQFPNESENEWKNLFKPCAAQRLFLPTLLSNEDAILYLDTDTLFISSVGKIWSHFKLFNSTQIAAVSPEHESSNIGWYNRFARHPFYGPYGINSGVMLMNLTRMRSFRWEQLIFRLYKEYKNNITWGDQDLINVLFHFHPDKVYILPCEFNYRPDHCMYSDFCKASGGIYIVHGNRRYFHVNKQPVFNALYKTIEKFQLSENSKKNLLIPLESAFLNKSISETNCGKNATKFLHQLRSIL